VGVNLNQVSEGIFAVYHPVWFFTWVVFAYGHTLLAAILYDPFRQTFDVRVLHAKVKDAGFPVFKVVFRFFSVRELKKFDANLVTGGQVRNPESSPTVAKDIVAHHADRGIVGDNLGWRHNDVPSQRFRVKVNGTV
jgi:hypothetical protein